MLTNFIEFFKHFLAIWGKKKMGNGKRGMGNEKMGLGRPESGNWKLVSRLPSPCSFPIPRFPLAISRFEGTISKCKIKTIKPRFSMNGAFP